MTRTLQSLTAVLLVTSLVGCVSQEKYNALKLDRDALSEQVAKAQTESSAARAEADLAKRNLDAMLQGGSNQVGLIANLSQQNASLQAQLEELNRRYGDAMKNIGGPLPEKLSHDLSALASAYPELVDFDAARGIIKFKSDVTFATGEATLQPKAKDVINRFASILNSSQASGYELMVAGHTDNQPVSNPRTKQAGHLDNWYLSAHRAITVAEALISQGTSAQRLGVVGYADQRPAAANTSESTRAQNRRVEVLILPTTVRGNGGVASTPTRAPAPRTGNKDSGSAGVGSAPVYNK